MGKKILFGFLMTALGLISLPTYANVRSSVGALENSFDTDELTMYTMIHVRDLRNELTSVCSDEAIDEAKAYTADGLAGLERKYATMNDAEVLRHSWELYERLREQHRETADSIQDEGVYCSVKYMMYEVQQYLRDAHLAIFEDTGIMKDFGGFNVTELHGYATKRRYLQMLVSELEGYKAELGKRLSFDIVNEDFEDDVDAQELELLSLTREIMELSVYKVLVNLKNAGLFNENDVDELKNNIELEYVDICGSVNGKYEIKETTTSGGEHIRYATDALHLKVNKCGNFFMLRDIAEVYEKIVVHELGHHFFYFHDRLGRDDFLDVCWNESDRSDIEGCIDRDFVSDYAQTHANEDYAEHFMYWFLGYIGDQSSKMKNKTSHFDEFL